MSLYNKYRPQTFEDFVGNEAEIDSLQKLLSKPDHPRVFLFSGPAGCGKTSMARVLTKFVNSDTLRELNTADDRGIDTARTIINDIQFISATPVVYILDEVHKTSNDFQNAMLKTLEEPPENVYFVLCSSEPGKIITAIKSRCTEIKFQALSEDDVLFLCRKILKSEGKKLSIDILELLASKAGGSPRDAIVLLERVVDVSQDTALALLEGGVADATTLTLCQMLLKEAEWNDIQKCLKALSSTDWESIRYAVLGYMSSVLLNSGKKRAFRIIEAFSEPFYNMGKAGLISACYSVTARG